MCHFLGHVADLSLHGCFCGFGINSEFHIVKTMDASVCALIDLDGQDKTYLVKYESCVYWFVILDRYFENKIQMTTTEAHDKSHRDAIMKEAITRFLDDNDIEMTKQSAQKLQRNLALWFQDKDPISTSFIYNYLQETYEYHEHNIQQQQGLGTISDESPIINILINTDPRSALSKSMPRIKKLLIISMFIAVCGLAGSVTLILCW